MHGDLCKHLGIDSSTDHPDQYSKLFLNAYINRHVHAYYLKMMGIWHVFYIVLTPISTTSGLWSTGNTRKYHQIDVYIYQCAYDVPISTHKDILYQFMVCRYKKNHAKLSMKSCSLLIKVKMKHLRVVKHEKHLFFGILICMRIWNFMLSWVEQLDYIYQGG